MRRPRYFTWFTVLVALFAATAACSLIIDKDKTNCNTDADCAHYAAGAVCRDNLCVEGTNVDGGGEGGPGDGGSEGATDASCQGRDGCFCGTPTTNEQFLNQCTTAECIPFDNCDKLGTCDGGFPGTVTPEGGSASSKNPDSGASSYCEDIIATLGGTPVYVTGSSNFPPFLKLVAPLLAKDNPKHFIVWQQTNSCTGVDTAFNPDPTKRVIAEGANKATFYYDDTGNQLPCFIRDTDPGSGIANAHAVDVGESDVFFSSCAATLTHQPDLAADGVGEYFGPIQTMTFITPPTSTQAVISAEAAQSVLGAGTVPLPDKLPWSDPNQIFIRTSSTGTNQIISRAVNVDPKQWWGVDKKSAAGMATAVQAVPSGLAEKTIGVISADTADQNRGNIKILAFQAHGQACGYLPDSTPQAKDKVNVRDGHYSMWGPLHFYTRLNAGAPSDAAAALVLRFGLPKLDQDLVTAIVNSGNIPACAMAVTRTTEMGPLQKFDSPYDCDCLFDKLTKGQPGSACKACATANDCPSTRPACNYGFCEVH